MSSGLDSTVGALLIGVILGAALWGVSCVQTFFYFSNYGQDPYYVKLLVVAVFLSDTIHQILISHVIYTYSVTYYGVVAELTTVVNTIVIEVLFNGFTALMVQGFFAYRIWKLSGGNLFVTTLVTILVIAEFVCVLVYVAKGINITTFAGISGLKNLSMTVNILAAAGDLLIAASMCILLHTSRTGFKASDSIINRLMIFVINTGLLTSLDAVGSLVSIVGWPNTFIYICFYFPLGRLYSNSLLATLNARSSIRQRGESASRSGEEVSLSFRPTGTGTRSMGMGGVFGNAGRTKSVAEMQLQAGVGGGKHNPTFVVVEQSTERHSDVMDESILKRSVNDAV